jgi:hypothetical protein
VQRRPIGTKGEFKEVADLPKIRPSKKAKAAASKVVMAAPHQPK